MLAAQVGSRSQAKLSCWCSHISKLLDPTQRVVLELDLSRIDRGRRRHGRCGLFGPAGAERPKPSPSQGSGEAPEGALLLCDKVKGFHGGVYVCLHNTLMFKGGGCIAIIRDFSENHINKKSSQ